MERNETTAASEEANPAEKHSTEKAKATALTDKPAADPHAETARQDAEQPISGVYRHNGEESEENENTPESQTEGIP